MNQKQTQPNQLLTIISSQPASFKTQLAVSELKRGLEKLGYRNVRPKAAGIAGHEPDELCFVFRTEHPHNNDETCDISYQAMDEASQITFSAANEQALLYGVFYFLEKQGAYFGIDGDLYPLEARGLNLPEGHKSWISKPQFAVRGLLPWPDFLNCITIYNREDWRAYLESMMRMRFNTLGIHVYSQSEKWVESFLSFEYGGTGHNAFLDSTASDRWGYLPQRTSRFGMGASQYFDAEVFGADADREARDPWEAAQFAQALWREAFNYAENLGIRTGVGFEPLQLPEEIVRACPPEVRVNFSLDGLTPDGQRRSKTFKRLDPDSRAARYVLETRLANLLETYPSITYVYLWEDEFTNWASQQQDIELRELPLLRSLEFTHDFLRVHAPEKRLVLAGWGGVARNFAAYHQVLPDDIIFTALSDQFGWDPIHKSFGELGDRERWPIPWLEDDPSMWFPQVHASRFAKDMAQAQDYGCQGMLGIHWRHRIIDPVAGYFARRSWEPNLDTKNHYGHYANTHTTATRAKTLADWFEKVDTERTLLSTWTGKVRSDGHAETQEFSGDYSEGFTVERSYDISDSYIAQQAEAIEELGVLLEQADSSLERERLGYWYNQTRFLDPYARAWQLGRKLHALIAEQHKHKKDDPDQVTKVIQEQALPVWVELLEYTREAVLSFQRGVATRSDLGTLASIHNKFVRIATWRFHEALLEFIDPLPEAAESALIAALAPDETLEPEVIVPTRPTRLSQGEQVRITALTPGALPVNDVDLQWRLLNSSSWNTTPMELRGRRTYVANLSQPSEAFESLEYRVKATFLGGHDVLTKYSPVEHCSFSLS